jgi:hypothetical protein
MARKVHIFPATRTETEQRPGAQQWPKGTAERRFGGSTGRVRESIPKLPKWAQDVEFMKLFFWKGQPRSGVRDAARHPSVTKPVNSCDNPPPGASKLGVMLVKSNFFQEFQMVSRSIADLDRGEKVVPSRAR